MLARCPGQKLPPPGARTPGTVRPEAHDAGTRAGPPSRPASPRPVPGRVFRNCAAVRAAGLAPLRRGTTDYAANPGLDRDKDGLACER